MQENYKSSLSEEKQRAVERMREMNARSKYSHMNTQKSEKPRSLFSELNIPFLSNMGTDSDIALILGLVLILYSEKSDKLLLLALLYVLM